MSIPLDVYHPTRSMMMPSWLQNKSSHFWQPYILQPDSVNVTIFVKVIHTWPMNFLPDVYHHPTRRVTISLELQNNFSHHQQPHIAQPDSVNVTIFVKVTRFAIVHTAHEIQVIPVPYLALTARKINIPGTGKDNKYTWKWYDGNVTTITTFFDSIANVLLLSNQQRLLHILAGGNLT